MASDFKAEILVLLKEYSRRLDQKIYIILEECIEKYVSDSYVALSFMIAHPHLFSDDVL